MPDPLSPPIMFLSVSPSPARDLHGKDTNTGDGDDDLTDAPTESRSPVFLSDTDDGANS